MGLALDVSELGVIVVLVWVGVSFVCLFVLKFTKNTSVDKGASVC